MIEYLHASIKHFVLTVQELQLLSGYCLCHKQLSKASRLDNKETDSKPVKLGHRSCMYNQCCDGLVSF